MAKTKDSRPVPYVAGQKVKPAAGTLVEYGNGAQAVVQENGRHKIVKGAAMARLNDARKSPRGAKPLSPKAAARAFNKFYKDRSYKSPKARKAAITRDLCHTAKTVVDTTSYKRSPLSKDYPNLDDGSKCPPGRKKYTYKSRAMPAAAVAGLKKFRTQAGGSPRGRKPVNPRGVASKCTFNTETMRCNNLEPGKKAVHPEHCARRVSNNRCYKVGGPKDAKKVALGKVLATKSPNRKAPKMDLGALKAELASTKDCKSRSEADCEKSIKGVKCQWSPKKKSCGHPTGKMHHVEEKVGIELGKAHSKGKRATRE